MIIPSLFEKLANIYKTRNFDEFSRFEPLCNLESGFWHGGLPACMYVCVYVWMDGWMDEWEVGWVGGWTDG
jgi:hypothetical protein